MNFLKLITIVNWAAIALLAYLVIAETLFPAKGGDAAGRGIGQAIYYLAIIGLVILLGLSLLPYSWAKYTAFGILVLPIAYIKLKPVVDNWKRNARYMAEDAKPIFPDQEREQLARAINNGEPEKLKKLLESPISNLNQGGELLSYAVNETASTHYKPEEKLACIRLLFDAGASLDSTNTDGVPLHMFVADVGNAPLLRLLLEHGADANAMQDNFQRPIIFEAVASYQQPEASVRALLEFGADPNATAILDEEQGKVSVLWRAAEMERWGVCAALLEKGAKPDFKTADGKSFSNFVDQAENFAAGTYSTREDYDRMKSLLK